MPSDLDLAEAALHAAQDELDANPDSRPAQVDYEGKWETFVRLNEAPVPAVDPADLSAEVGDEPIFDAVTAEQAAE